MTAAPETDFALKDGTSVHLRPIRPEDEHRLIEIFNHSSPQSVYQRFFAALPELTPAMASRLSNVDYVHRFALIAETDGEAVGVARYDCTEDPEVVELGLAIVDHWQNHGIGRILLREIMRAAERNGIYRFRAEVLAENRRMLHLLESEGQIQGEKIAGGVTTISFTSRRARRS